jgi:NADP-dependent aldehyde dehydrogenase
VPIPFFGELGSANPLIVTPAAARERANEIGEGIGASMTLGVGQFCTKPGLLFVPHGEHGDALVAALVASLRELSAMTMLAPGIASHFREGAHAITAVSGANLLVGDELGEGTSVTSQLLEVAAATFTEAGARVLREECFGPLAVVVRYTTSDELAGALEVADPALTFSFFSAPEDPDAPWLTALGERKAGRVVANAYPTGVGVSWSMQHGGPWPATTAVAATSVGAAGIERWLRPVTYQNMPAELLPEALRDDNPLGIPQRVDGLRR